MSDRALEFEAMRCVAFLLLFTAVGSLQLPWVACEVEAVHLDMGAEAHCGCEHEQPPEPAPQDHSNGGDHETVQWPAVPGNQVVVVPLAAAVYGCFREQALPAPDATIAAVRARASAPPVAVCPRTFVLLL